MIVKFCELVNSWEKIKTFSCCVLYRIPDLACLMCVFDNLRSIFNFSHRPISTPPHFFIFSGYWSEKREPKLVKDIYNRMGRGEMIKMVGKNWAAGMGFFLIQFKTLDESAERQARCGMVITKFKDKTRL